MKINKNNVKPDKTISRFFKSGIVDKCRDVIAKHVKVVSNHVEYCFTFE